MTYPGSKKTVRLPLFREKGGARDRREGGPPAEMHQSDLAALLRSGAAAFLRASPGAGKTTTLLQIGSAVLDTTSDAIPLFVPLSEAAKSGDLLEAAARRLTLSSSGLHRDALARLATQAHLILLCDGWNEVSASDRSTLATALADLRAQAPSVGVVVASRLSDPALPITDPLILHLGVLTEAQQDAIAADLGGASSAALLEHARATPDLAELIENPFYLCALVRTYVGGPLPGTKEDVVRALVAKLEAERSVSLWARFHGTQQKYLRGIAVALQQARRVSLEEDAALAALHEVGDMLVRSHALRAASEPIDTLNALADGHLLVRSATADSLFVGFQHQLFQEWYASFEVESAMRLAPSSDPDASRRFVSLFLNEPWWDEAVLFACERVAARQEFLPALAKAIRSAFQLDIAFAAKIVRRAGDAAWAAVRKDIAPTVEAWLTSTDFERALNFIYRSGRSDFADSLWRVLTSADGQSRLGVLRTDELSLQALGPDAKARILAASEPLAIELLSELSFSGGPREFGFAVDAARDMSPAVIAAVAEALAFRGARLHLKQLLQGVPQAAWDLIARTNHLDSVLDGDDADRLLSARCLLLENAPTPLERLRLRASGASASESPSVRSDIAQADFPPEPTASWYPLLQTLSKRFLDDVRLGLIDRVINGRSLPTSSHHLLAGAVCEDERVARAAQDPATSLHIAEALSATLSAELVTRLVDTYVSSRPTASSMHGWDTYGRLRTLLAAVPADRLIPVLADRRREVAADVVGALAELLQSVGQDDRERRQPFDAGLKATVLPMLIAWADVVLFDPDASRGDLASVACAIGRSGWAELTGPLSALEKRDSTLLNGETEALQVERARRTGPITARKLYGHRYADAFIRLAGAPAAEVMKARLNDPDFGLDAARALRGIWQREAGLTLDPPSVFAASSRRWRPDPLRRTLDAHPYAVAIVDAALAVGAATPRHIHRSLELFAVAAWMPYGSLRDALLDTVQQFRRNRGILGVLRGLADAGELLDSKLLLEWCRSETGAIQAARSMDHEWWRVEDFLELLPFSDAPAALLDAVADLEVGELGLRRPSFDRVFGSLRDAADERTDAILVELATRIPHLVDDAAWVRAISDRDSEAVTRALASFAMLIDARSDQAQQRDGSYLELTLGALLRKYREVARELIESLRGLSVPKHRSLVASALATVPDSAIVLALVEHEGRNSPEGHGSIPADGIEGLVTEHYTDPAWGTGAYAVLPRAAPDLRRRLFELSQGADARAKLASRCLEYIEGLRRQYGRPDDEPRHPAWT